MHVGVGQRGFKRAAALSTRQRRGIIVWVLLQPRALASCRCAKHPVHLQSNSLSPHTREARRGIRRALTSWSTSLCPGKRGAPPSSSAKTQPAAQQSTPLPYALAPYSSSGARYHLVVPLASGSGAALSRHALPKSASFSRPSRPMSRLAGLTSCAGRAAQLGAEPQLRRRRTRCSTPRAWHAPRARNTSSNSAFTAATESGASRRLKTWKQDQSRREPPASTARRRA